MGYSPWGCKESDMTERLHLPHFPLLFAMKQLDFPGGSDCKESTCNAGHLSSIPGLGRPPEGGHGNPLQYFYLENLHGQSSLMGYSPQCCKELGMTE